VSMLLDAWLARTERRCLYWWEPADGSVNVGDYLSKVIVSSMLSLRDLELREKREHRRRLFAVGSVLHNAKDGETVWGSGINGKIPAQQHAFRQLDVRAVRGPLTRRFLAEKGIMAPEIYGDPALLMPRFFPADLLEAGPQRDFVVVPHFNEPADKFSRYQDQLVLPTSKPVEFVRQLLSAKFVVSSSLHGIILAEAYGLPAIYLDSGNGENRFKYDDYYHGTGRMQWHSGGSVEECLERGGNDGFDLGRLQQGLMGAFPYDLW
jgi:pyruvyltransferase